MIVLRHVALLLAFSAIPAAAQSIDHDAFEQMFGEPVTASATGKPQRASEAPADMVILTAAQIQRSGAVNIPDALQQVPGIDVRRYGELDVSVGIRGYETALNPRVLVLLDGRQVYQDDYGLTVWSTIPVAIGEIRQIEIIKGPAAALYGFNAVSGVINIVTYDPLINTVNEAAVQAGTQSQTSGEAVTTVHLSDHAGIRMSAKGFRSTEFAGNDGGNTREQPHSGTVAVDGRFRIGSAIEWNLAASIGSLDSDYNLENGSYLPLSFRTNSLRSRIVYDTRFGVLQLDAYRNENRTAAIGGYLSTSWRQDVTVVQASDLLKIGGAHTLRIAGEYRNNAVSSLEAYGGRLGYTIGAGSLMWDWQVLPGLSLTNALRIDRMSLYHQGRQIVVAGLGPLFQPTTITQPSFNSGAVFRLSSYEIIRASAARATQLPSLVDLGLARTFGPIVVAGNSQLQPSRVTNYEIDYDRNLPELRSTLRIAAFAQHSDEAIGSPFASGVSMHPGGGIILRAHNFGDSNEIGGEIGLTGSLPSGIHWNLSYAFAAVHDETPDELLTQAASVAFQRQTPVHSVLAGIGRSWQRLDLDVLAQWQSHYQDFGEIQTATLKPALVVVPNYVAVDARLAYRLTPHVTLSLVGAQLLRQRLMETAGLRVERRILAGVKVGF